MRMCSDNPFMKHVVEVRDAVSEIVCAVELTSVRSIDVGHQRSFAPTVLGIRRGCLATAVDVPVAVVLDMVNMVFRFFRDDTFRMLRFDIEAFLR